jgi:hypothetical protein
MSEYGDVKQTNGAEDQEPVGRVCGGHKQETWGNKLPLHCLVSPCPASLAIKSP